MMYEEGKKSTRCAVYLQMMYMKSRQRSDEEERRELKRIREGKAVLP